MKTHPDLLDSIKIFDAEAAVVQTDPLYKRRMLGQIFMRERRIRMRRWMMAASITGLLFAMGFYLFSMTKTPGSVAESPVAAVKGFPVENRTAADMWYMLPDSSQILLRPSAAIIYGGDFESNRIVSITSGNVYFKVQHDKDRPFRVVNNGIIVTVLGTEFWVRTTAEHKNIQVYLEQGKIVISADPSAISMDSIFMKPGESCDINMEQGTARVNRVVSEAAPLSVKRPRVAKIRSADEVLWTNNSIRFRNSSFSAMIPKLEQQFEVKIEVGDPEILRYRITGRLFQKDSIKTIMDAICEIHDLSYEMQGRKIILTQRKK
ncbi:FecR family protein [Niabella terrae]